MDTWTNLANAAADHVRNVEAQEGTLYSNLDGIPPTYLERTRRVRDVILALAADADREHRLER